MSRTNNRMLLVAGLAIAVIVSLSLAILGPSSFLGLNYFGKATLSGNTPAAISHSQRVNHADPNEQMNILVSLNLRDEAALNQLLADMRDPASPQYRKFITANEFAQRFAPANADVDKVIAFLKEYGLQVVEVSPNRTLIEAKGSISQLERAFGVTINRYSLVGSGSGTKTFLSNDRDPRIPSSLEPIVLSVIGLDTLAEFENRMLKNSKAAAPKTTRPWGFSPQDIARVYDFPNSNNDKDTSGLSGKGKTIAIATAHVYDIKDIEEFWKQYNITRTGKLIDVHVGGVSTEINGETTLDLEIASSQAPGADIMMYMGKDPRFTTFTKVFNKIVTDDTADVMSISWGLCETNTGRRQMKTEHNIFKQGAAQGIAMFAASGDDGAYDCKPPAKDEDDKDNDATQAPKTPDLAVDYPSSDPYIIAVGGTSLYAWNGKRSSESAWHGSGGGISDEWPRQSWQHGPGVPNSDNRPSADVSLVANPGTGYAIYFEGKWEEIGGTSASAPSWAALWVLIDEGAGKRIGDPGEILYRVGRSLDYQFNFTDITSGDNGDFRGPGYKAGPNWDHPTGWGVPKGQKLKDWIIKDQKGTP